jgi:hypothetical protein
LPILAEWSFKKMNKKEKIKNIAIIFLVAMLILTLFSNTIMNWSLPEVAVQYPGYQQISQQITGTGTIEAADTYQIKTGSAKTVTGVFVKTDDYVEKDQLLFTLDTGDSEELSAAKDALRSAQDEYDKLLLTNGKDYTLDELNLKNKEDEYNKALDRQTNYEKYEAAYNAAKDARIAAEKIADELKNQQTEINSENKYGVYVYVSESDAKKLIAAADKITKLNTELEAAKKKLEELNASLPSSSADFIALRQEVLKYENLLRNLNGELAQIPTIIDDPDEVAAAGEERRRLKSEINEAKSNLEIAEKRYKEAVSASSAANLLKSQIEAQTGLISSYNTQIDKASEEQTALKAQLTKAIAEKITDSENTVADLTAKEAEAKTDMGGTKAEVDKSVRDLLYSLEEQRLSLSEKKENDAIESGKSAIDIATKKEQLDELKEKVEKLEENTDEGSKIVAPVAGIVTTVNLVSGNTTEAGGLAAEIAVTASGYTASFSVTNDQARRVNVGDVAEVTNGYWYGDSTIATLSSIKADETDPGTKKKLVFKITGDVTPGQSLSLQLGQRAEYYPSVVPNSAIREDNEGKFVLQLQAKNTPLGSRYTAVRVDITVVATDGKVSAVSGLDDMLAVITTSSLPITPGTQVRLANSN